MLYSPYICINCHEKLVFANPHFSQKTFDTPQLSVDVGTLLLSGSVAVISIEDEIVSTLTSLFQILRKTVF